MGGLFLFHQRHMHRSHDKEISRIKHALDKAKDEKYKKRIALGKCAVRYGTTFAARTFNEKEHVAYYWKKKVIDPDFHPNQWGGVHTVLPYDVEEAESLAWHFIQNNRQVQLRDIQIHLDQHGIQVSRATVSRMLTKWRWSFKIPSIMQKQKYSLENLTYYVDFCRWFGTRTFAQLRKLKFIDEVHFKTRDFRNKKYALAPIGQRIVVSASDRLDTSSWNATVLIRVNSAADPIALDIRQDSNTAYDFTLFVMMMVEKGFLVDGDYLIYDNAAVHLCSEVFMDLTQYLETHGITPLPLPTYSPELNPIERCFNIVKNYLRYQRDPEVPLLRDIMRGFALITQEIIAKEYLYSAQYLAEKPLLLPPPLQAILRM